MTFAAHSHVWQMCMSEKSLSVKSRSWYKIESDVDMRTPGEIEENNGVYLIILSIQLELLT